MPARIPAVRALPPTSALYAASHPRTEVADDHAEEIAPVSHGAKAAALKRRLRTQKEALVAAPAHFALDGVCSHSRGEVNGFAAADWFGASCEFFDHLGGAMWAIVWPCCCGRNPVVKCRWSRLTPAVRPAGRMERSCRSAAAISSFARSVVEWFPPGTGLRPVFFASAH